MIFWGYVPFAVLASIISVNNAIAGVILGPILLIVLYPRVKRWGLLWTEIMTPDEVPASRLQTVGNALMWIGGIGALVVGLILGSALRPGCRPASDGLGVGLGLIRSLPHLIVVAASCSAGANRSRPQKRKRPASPIPAREESCRANPSSGTRPSPRTATGR